MDRSVLRAALAAHLHYDAAEADSARRMAELLDTGGACFLRSDFPGHFTASCWLVSADGWRAALMHHRKLDRWLQPGGHADGEVDLPAVALREAGEETGLTGLVVLPEIFDVDVHAIPARGSEPQHWHHDVRFVVRATDDEIFRGNHESRAIVWREVAVIAQDAALDPSIRRMAQKWLAQQTR